MNVHVMILAIHKTGNWLNSSFQNDPKYIVTSFVHCNYFHGTSIFTYNLQPDIQHTLLSLYTIASVWNKFCTLSELTLNISRMAVEVVLQCEQLFSQSEKQLHRGSRQQLCDVPHTCNRRIHRVSQLLPFRSAHSVSEALLYTVSLQLQENRLLLIYIQHTNIRSSEKTQEYYIAILLLVT